MYKMWNFLAALVCTLAVTVASLESNDLHKHHNDESHENHDSHEHDHGHAHKQKRHVGYYQQPLPEVHYDYIQPAYYDHYEPPAYYPPANYHHKPPCNKHHTTTTTTTTTPKPHFHHKPLHHKHPEHIPDKALWDKKVELIQDKLEAIHALKDKSVSKVKDVLDHVLFPESRSDPTEARSDPAEAAADSRTFLEPKCACEEQIGLLEVSVLQLGDELRKVKSFLAAKEATLLDGTTKIVKVVKVEDEGRELEEK